MHGSPRFLGVVGLRLALGPAHHIVLTVLHNSGAQLGLVQPSSAAHRMHAGDLRVCLYHNRVGAVSTARVCWAVVATVHGKAPDLGAEVLAILVLLRVEAHTCRVVWITRPRTTSV